MRLAGCSSGYSLIFPALGKNSYTARSYEGYDIEHSAVSSPKTLATDSHGFSRNKIIQADPWNPCWSVADLFFSWLPDTRSPGA